MIVLFAYAWLRTRYQYDLHQNFVFKLNCSIAVTETVVWVNSSKSGILTAQFSGAGSYAILLEKCPEKITE